MELIQLSYASAALVPFDQAGLGDLLTRARAKNHSLGVSGLLIYHDGSFIQFLEGDPEVVSELYGTIEADKRHGEFQLIMRRNVDERCFGDWRMGFYCTRSTVNEDGFVDILKTVSTSSLGLEGKSAQIARVIDGFRDGKWRQKVLVS